MSNIIHIRSNIRVLSKMGLWKYGPEGEKRTTAEKALSVLILVIYSVHWLAMVTKMFHVTGYVPLESMTISMLAFMVIMRVSPFFFRRKKLYKLLKQMYKCEQNSLNNLRDHTTKISENAIKRARKFSTIYFGLCSVAVLGVLTERPVEYLLTGPQAIYNYKPKHIFSPWFPFDEYSSKNYPFVYAYHMTIGVIGACYLYTIDSFLISLMIFSIEQFQVLQYWIEVLDETTISWDYIKYIVDQHCEVIKFIKILNDISNPIFFFHFLTWTLTVCACTFDGATSALYLARSFVMMLVLLVQIFAFYWYANEITVQSSALGTAVGRGNWYKLPTPFQKAMGMILLMSKKPSVLLVGVFYKMSLDTFIMILKTSVSFAAVFQQLYSRN